MGATKKSKPSADIADIQSDVASFASTLGFSSGGATFDGFNDSDFRKTGSFKPKPESAEIKPRKAKSKPNSETKTSKSKPNSEFKASKYPPKENNRKTIPKPAKSPSQAPHSDALVEEKAYNDKYKNLPKLPLVKANTLGKWYEDAAELEGKLIGSDKKIEYNSVAEWNGFVENKKELGERLLAQYVQDYMSSRGQSGDIKMLITTQRSGTAADKVSALSVMIGDNAVANLRSVDVLLGMVTSKVGKRHAFTAFEALKEMFIILLPDRKLKTLYQRPLNHLSDTKDSNSLLLFWHWEDCLKERYDRFISALEEASLDVIFKLKSLALKIIHTLLISKSEQERRLLASLVNKLGDPERKGASDADYHLTDLLRLHPNMKVVVIEEVDNFLFRPHLGMRAKYYAVNFLNQIRLGHKGNGPKAAKRLVDIYFALFKILISEAGAAFSTEQKERKAPSSSKDKSKASSDPHIEMDSRLLSALLTGINRAFPYVSGDEAHDIVDVQTPLLFKLVHSKNFNVGVQALMLIDKIASRNQIVSDRFYRALYSKLLLPAAMFSSKEELFINLLVKAMKNDIHINRVAAFAKRLLQVALQLPPQNACGCLYMLSEVLKARPPLWNMVLQNETADSDEDLEHFEDVLDRDDSKAILALDDKTNGDHAVVTSNESDEDTASSLDEDGSETSGSENDNVDEGDNFLREEPEEVISVPDHQTHNLQAHTLHRGYNPRHRDPTYCNAERVGWWELTILASHVHPSVAAWATKLLVGVNIEYGGNPLTDFTIGAFLDKFMEKKPRQTTWRGPSEIEPAKKLDMNHPLLGAEILSLAENEVPPEDVVFHKFYMNKMNSSKKPKKKKKKTDEEEAAEELYDVEGDEDVSDDEEIENMLDTNSPFEEKGEYDSDDFDQIADEDDEDLIGDASDEEMDFPSDIDIEEDGDVDLSEGDDDDSDIAIGQGDDGSESDEVLDQRPKKRKSHKRGKSSFASIEEYKHLLEADDDDAPTPDASTKSRKNKTSKKSGKNKKRKTT